MPEQRACKSCGITPKGMRSDRATISPSGIVHLRANAGHTFCGKWPTLAWRKP